MRFEQVHQTNSHLYFRAMVKHSRQMFGKPPKNFQEKKKCLLQSADPGDRPQSCQREAVRGSLERGSSPRRQELKKRFRPKIPGWLTLNM